MTPLNFTLLVLVFTINGVGLGWGLACLYFQNQMLKDIGPRPKRFRPEEPHEPWERPPDWWKR